MRAPKMKSLAGTRRGPVRADGERPHAWQAGVWDAIEVVSASIDSERVSTTLARSADNSSHHSWQDPTLVPLLLAQSYAGRETERAALPQWSYPSIRLPGWEARTYCRRTGAQDAWVLSGSRVTRPKWIGKRRVNLSVRTC